MKLTTLAARTLEGLAVLSLFSCGVLGPSTCESEMSANQAALAKYVTVATETQCQQTSDCVVYQGQAMSAIAASGYKAYYASSDYHPASFACSFHGSVIAPSQYPTQATCTNRQCVAVASTNLSCDQIDQHETTLLNQFVNVATQYNCSQDSDCVTAPTRVCSNIVNRTAAQGYQQYYSSTQYQTLQQQGQSAGCVVVGGTCPTQQNPGCIMGQCGSR